ncbi:MULTISPECIES: head-tail connector protein [Leclercia]|uniref:head-tail connector protein n=1 Tax=Leclercia TaxID=83654 RepID=UPI001E5024BF|nr:MULTISPECIES: head-tail connector protein [Leclercia]MCH2683561.1 head-tail connector protein [Leclercia adecarboxylata]UGB01212.1 head-tail connector protein [Leclercia sp. G3L]WNY86609.1 head-tail connector protein [Leclercia adecarboxylata]
MLTKEQVKTHCRIDTDNNAEDDWIEISIKGAARYVQKWTRRQLYEKDDDPRYLSDPDALLYGEDIEIAMLMLIAHWYSNREAVITSGTSSTVDLAVESLLQPYRIYGL